MTDTKKYSITLDKLLTKLVSCEGLDLIEIKGLTLDSRKIEKEMLFCAVKGETVNGIEYINHAIESGAAAVLWEAEKGVDAIQVNWRSTTNDRRVPVIAIADLSQKVGEIADCFYQSPSKQISVCGITGTNGKTSCAHFLAQAFSMQARTGIMGTLGAGIFPNMEETGFTTPNAITCHSWLAHMVDNAADYSVMEVSSHALVQGRVNGIEFKNAVFTNISHEHLDYHGDMESYANAKSKLFKFPGLENAVINSDDEYGRKIISSVATGVKLIKYGLDQKFKPDVYGHDLVLDASGLSMQVSTPWGQGKLSSSLIGEFNASNLLAVLSVLLVEGVELNECLARISKLGSVPGRMQRIAADNGPIVIVDFAHTPDALEKSLETLRKHTGGKLWCVFGCGGDRDKVKRPLMGSIAEEKADHIVLTNDNPRNEIPGDIINDIKSGIKSANNVHVQEDRHEAIKYAITGANDDDIILVAGKGHENFQIIGSDRVPFSDVEEVQQQLKAIAV